MAVSAVSTAGHRYQARGSVAAGWIGSVGSVGIEVAVDVVKPDLGVRSGHLGCNTPTRTGDTPGARAIWRGWVLFGQQRMEGVVIS